MCVPTSSGKADGIVAGGSKLNPSNFFLQRSKVVTYTPMRRSIPEELGKSDMRLAKRTQAVGFLEPVWKREDPMRLNASLDMSTQRHCSSIT